MPSDSVRVRELVPGDSEALWRIRNHDVVRNMSHDATPIPWERHTAWFAGYLPRDDKRAFVLEQDGRVVGYCRIDQGLVSIAIDPEHHHQGLGRQLLIQAVQQSHDQWPTIVAECRKNNPVSLRLFENAGFNFVREEADRIVLEHRLSSQAA